MIEVYLFLAVFPVQILAMSVLYPARYVRLMRTALANIPAERVTELYPEVDVGRAQERFLTRYRAANAIVAVLERKLQILANGARKRCKEGAALEYERALSELYK